MLLVSLALFVPLAVIVRICAGHWLHPGAMFAGYWTIASALPLAFYGHETTNRALIYIAVGVAAFSVGSLVLVRTRSPLTGVAVATPKPTLNVKHQILVWTIAVGTISGFGAGLLAIRANGVPVDSLLSTDGLLDIPSQVSVSRYSDLLTQDASGAQLVVSALLSFTYCAALTAPFIALTEIRFKRLWVLAPLVSLVFYGVLTTARFGMLCGVFLSFGGYLAMRTLKDGQPPRFTSRGIAATAATVLVVAALFTTMAFLRIGKFDANTASIVRDRVAIYTLGYQPGFSKWLDQREWPVVGERQLGLGSASVAGVSLVTGQSRKDFRAYGEFVVIDERGNMTNIYTIFRGLLIDFGRSGGMLTLFLLGAAASAAYRAVIRRRSATAATILACCYGIILWSNTMSVVHFSNVLAAMLGSVLVVNRAVVRSRATEQIRSAPTLGGSQGTSVPRLHHPQSHCPKLKVVL